MIGLEGGGNKSEDILFYLFQ